MPTTSTVKLRHNLRNLKEPTSQLICILGLPHQSFEERLLGYIFINQLLHSVLLRSLSKYGIQIFRIISDDVKK